MEALKFGAPAAKKKKSEGVNEKKGASDEEVATPMKVSDWVLMVRCHSFDLFKWLNLPRSFLARIPWGQHLGPSDYHVEI
jgi:hypothetical protein